MLNIITQATSVPNNDVTFTIKNNTFLLSPFIYPLIFTFKVALNRLLIL